MWCILQWADVTTRMRFYRTPLARPTQYETPCSEKHLKQIFEEISPANMSDAQQFRPSVVSSQTQI